MINSTTSDEKLVASIKLSDDKALKILYLRYYDAILKFLYNRLYSMELAKDFTQEVFTRIWQTRSRLDPNRSIKSYLFTIGNNLVLDHFKAKSSKNDSLENVSLKNHPSTSENIELRLTLENAINKMPDDLQNIFILSRKAGFKYAEIAEAYQISIKTVEKKMSLALKFLKKELSEL